MKTKLTNLNNIETIMTNIHKVKDFWEENPLFTGESSYKSGSKEFFEEHYNIYINDCFPRKDR